MASIEQIDRAIGGHGQWKTRLKSAIRAGQLDTRVETIRVDDECDFGKWLCGRTLTPQDKATTHYRSVKALHAEFHRTAARVAELAVSGRGPEADEMLAFDGEFSRISAKLTQAMMEWKKISR